MSLRRLGGVVMITITCLGLFVMQSCTKLAKNLQYDLALQTGSVSIVLPVVTDINNTVKGEQMSYYNVDSFIKANTANVLGLSNVTSAILTSCIITIDSPLYAYQDTTNNFANMSSCSIAVSSNTNQNPYEVTIDYSPNVYATSMSLPVNKGIDVKSYLSGTMFTYALSAKLRRPTTHPLKCSVQFTYSVHVEG